MCIAESIPQPCLNFLIIAQFLRVTSYADKGFLLEGNRKTCCGMNLQYAYPHIRRIFNVLKIKIGIIGETVSKPVLKFLVSYA